MSMYLTYMVSSPSPDLCPNGRVSYTHHSTPRPSLSLDQYPQQATRGQPLRCPMSQHSPRCHGYINGYQPLRGPMSQHSPRCNGYINGYRLATQMSKIRLQRSALTWNIIPS